jgi:hypothetical protein
LTETEIAVLDRLVNDKPHARRKTLSHYLIKIARLGGYLARDDGFVGIAVVVPDLDAMQPFDRNLIHLVGDRVISISRQAVDAGPDYEVRSGFSSRAEQLVDVALAIGDVNASSRLA